MGEGTFVTKSNKNRNKSRSLQLPIDVPLLLIVVLLLVFGLLIVYSASWDFSILMGKERTYIFGRQIIWIVLGCITATIATFIDYHFYQKILVPLGLGTLALLLAVLIVNQQADDEFTRMLLGGSIQPSELAKAVIVIYLSYWLFRRKESINDMQIALIPLVVILGITFGLIFLQPDLSAALTVLLMGIMLLSASQRMTLYEDAFGFTHLRVYVHVFIFWLAMLFIAFSLEMFRVKTNVFSLGALLAVIGFLATLNLMNVDLYIAERNLGRFENGRQLDVCYLRRLSVDAVPAMVQLRDSVQDADTVRHIEWWLRKQLHDLDNIYADDFALTYNWSRDRAWNALNPIRDVLPAYNAFGRDSACSTYVPR